MANIYEDGKYLDNNPTWHMEHSRWKAEHVVGILMRNKVNEIKTAVEIGCGGGGVIYNFKKLYPGDTECSGYDISPNAITICKENYITDVNFECKDLLCLDRYFDIVLCMDVFEHVEDYIGFLRALKAKAIWKVFHIPLEISCRNVFFHHTILQSRVKVNHLHHFFKESALDSLRIAGYEIIDWVYTDGIDLQKSVNQTTLIKKLAYRVFRQPIYVLNKDIAARVMGGYSLLVLAK